VDITAQKKAESALRAARDTFMKLVQNSPFGVYIVDADFKLVQVSNGARKVFEKVTPLLERDFAEVMRCIWQEPFASEVIQRFRHTLETGETYHSPSTVEPRQDVPRIEAYDWKIERIMLPEGKWGVVCHFYDLSERQQFEAALRESEARFRNMADHAPVVIWVTNEHHDCIFLSKSWYDMTGMAPDSGLGWRWLDAIHSDDRSGVEKGFKDACRDKTGFCCEYRLQDGHGGYRWVIDSAQIRKGEGNLFLGYVGSVTDITERKKIEIELAETRERLEAALAAGDVATWVWDVAANRIYSDRNLRAMFGIRADAVKGAPLEEYLQAVHPEDQDLVRAKIQEAMTTGRYYECIYRVAPQAGQIRWVLARAQIERNSSGKAVRMPGVVMDVSRQKEAEIELQKARAELRQYADNLEHLVRSRTARLQELVAELEHFSYTITHDMRAPLRAMRGFAEVLQEMLHDSPQPEIHTFLRRIMTSAERMDLLITDALNYGKAVRQDLPLFPVKLQDLIEGMLDTYPEFQADRADIVIHGQIPPVVGNEAGLTQCFSNLISNAVKFVEAGKKPHVQIRAAVISYPEGNYVRISVEDKGIGIPEKMLPRVFDMFARGTHTYEGTGIGLALVRKVVQRMNGRVGVESGLGKGSRFWVELQAA
jgi:PAS domain S-box-containing protein